VAGACWLRSIRARRALRGPAAWLMRAAKAAWKLARRLPLANRIEIEMPVDGHRMRVRLFSYDDLLTIAEEYEACLAHHLPPQGGTAVDAGAYIGRHTLAYARAVGPEGRVIAVEPLPANFRLLQHNVRSNGYQQTVRCAACALGRNQGQIRLGYGKETSIASAHGDFPLHLTVVQRSLDDLLSEQGIAQIDFLKIDVEGAELDVLMGSRQVLDASPQARLVVEIHARPDSVETCPVHRWLRECGYSIAALHEEHRLFYWAKKMP